MLESFIEKRLRCESSDIVVVDISFIFNNYQLLKMLEQRGDALKNGDHEKVSKIQT